MVLWTDGSDPFPFGKGGSGVLANCSLCGTEVTLSFSTGLVRLIFSAKAYAILHFYTGLGSTIKSATSHFLSSNLTLVFSSPLCSVLLLPQSLWQELSSLSSCSIRLRWVPGHSFLLRFPPKNLCSLVTLAVLPLVYAASDTVYC